VSVKLALDVLMPRFLDDHRDSEQWDVMSYPMLGPAQMRYTHYMPWYGFKPEGQAVMQFHVMDGISIEVLQKNRRPPLPDGYRLVSWQPQYHAGVCDVLAEAFTDSADARWDPRFRTRQGIEEALAFVQSGNYGMFSPDCTTVLLNAEGNPVGVCLLNIVSAEEANIPLIGLFKAERRHKLGQLLLAHTVERCIHAMMQGKFNIAVISATVATANIPAIRMYRYTAFQELQWYPHIYQSREAVLARRPNAWC
jgi:GNAT superfamily N-acetyltransferase